MKKESKLFLCLTLAIVITLVIVSAGCLSMFSTPTSSTSKLPTTPDISKITPSSSTTKYVTPVTEKKDTMMGKWKMAASFNDYSLVINIKDETTAEYDMTVKSAKGFNSDNAEDDMEYETGDIIHAECKLVKKSDGSYSLDGIEGGVIRKGEHLLWGDLNGYNFGSLKYNKETDKLTYAVEGETLSFTRTS